MVVTMSSKIKDVDLHHLRIEPINDTVSSQQEISSTPIVDLNNVKVLKTDDVYQHACNITAWQQLYDQLKPGKFTGQLDECWFEGIQFFKEYTSSALRQSCMVWPKAVWLGIPPLSETIDGYIGSQIISKHTIAIREGGKEFELNTPDDYTIMGLVVDLDVLIKHISCVYKEYEDYVLPFLSYTTLEVNSLQKQYICQLIQQALLAGMDNSNLTHHPSIIKTIRQDLLDNLAHLLFTSKQVDTKLSRTRVNYQKIVTKARDYALDHPQDIITVSDLCEYLSVSRRTLQNCFQTVWGISPYAYLKAIRLNAVRRELESRYSKHRTVQDAAMAWGFWHMSQFAIDYNNLFGELPSQSLAARGHLQTYWL